MGENYIGRDQLNVPLATTTFRYDKRTEELGVWVFFDNEPKFVKIDNHGACIS